MTHRSDYDAAVSRAEVWERTARDLEQTVKEREAEIQRLKDSFVEKLTDSLEDMEKPEEPKIRRDKRLDPKSTLGGIAFIVSLPFHLIVPLFALMSSSVWKWRLLYMTVVSWAFVGSFVYFGVRGAAKDAVALMVLFSLGFWILGWFWSSGDSPTRLRYSHPWVRIDEKALKVSSWWINHWKETEKK